MTRGERTPPRCGRGRREVDPQRLVWVRTGGPGGSGSGYLIGPQLVLTALHVVRVEGRWAGRVEARVGHPRYGAGPVDRRARVCWPDPQQGVPPADALDVALLWLEESVVTGGEPVRWGRPAGVVPVPFEGAGFPAFAAEGDDPGQFEYVRGELPAVSTSSSGWVLDCPVWPAAGRGGERPWAGASGSAIFCRDRLVGVAVEDNRALGWRRLQAAPIHEALSLPGFAALVSRHGHIGTTTVLEEVAAQATAAGSGRGDVVWPVEVGTVPTLASAFQPRSTLREQVDAARAGGGSVVLTQVLSGGGGVGKTQLAAACATDALKDGFDVVIWAPATEIQQVITQYARAAANLHLPGVSGQDPESDADLLLKWLMTTRRRWLVVLDDITDPAAVNRWWPTSRTGTGWVLATTRRKDALLTGGGRTRIDIDVYTVEEADAYLRARLTADGMEHLLDDSAVALAEALGYLPLALGLAAAHMINEELTCTTYLRRFTDRQTRLEQALPQTADTEGYGRQITAALLLSLHAAHAADSTGLAVPVLHVAALLDPAGHPHALWTTPPLLDYLTIQNTRRTAEGPVAGVQATADHAHSALRLLHRYALLTCDTRAEPRTVRIHALTARAVRESIREADLPALATAAANALIHVWPEVDQPHADLAAALRANTDALAEHTRDCLWRPEGHSVLYRAGMSLLDAGLARTATAYWRSLADNAEHLLGNDHTDALAARANLALSYWQAGRTDEAVAIEERVLADRERLFGDNHPDTLTARANLALSYWQAGRTDEAITMLERVVADRERLFGDNHQDTLTARSNLAVSYGQAGRTDEAITILERVVADLERLLGDNHPDTLTARSNLAASYGQAGRVDEAVAIEERVLADRERLFGDDHPNTLTARVNLAVSYGQAGRVDEAITILEQVVADLERLLGDNHPNTLTARSNLAISYGQAGRVDEAVAIEERVLPDRERLLGDNHPDTLTSRASLAVFYGRAGRVDEAITILEQVVADRERLLGDNHPDTLTSRANLALSYWQAGRTDEAITIEERVLADRERLLGDNHPNTLTARSNLAISYRQAGRVDEAITILEQVVADRERLLGDNHPNTLTARSNLEYARRSVGKDPAG
ncbi:tetratricopeptide repeat protein [Streptomyces lavendulocolor]|uniref:tetratricopeptide repeat protein n=1 Tax=Streptomyces lavendulocolor TaxID=67316 RepID=UPI003405C57E